MKRRKLKDKRKIQHPKMITSLAVSYAKRRRVNGSQGVINHRYREILGGSEELDRDSIPDYVVPKRGLPLLICQPDVYARVLEVIRAGNYPSTAAKMVGVAYTTLRNWLQDGKAGKNKLLYDFYKDVQRAEAEAEANRLADVTAQIPKDWRAGMDILSRRWPENWAKKDINYSKVQIEGELKHDVRNNFAQKVIDDPQSREAARALIARIPVLIQGTATQVTDEDPDGYQ